jgi:hypothetical protein
MTNTLRIDITDSDTTLVLEQSTSFPSNGYVKIEDEIIKYSFSSDLNLLQCTRGSFGTTAVSHLTGAIVSEYLDIRTDAENNSIIELISPAVIPVDVIDKVDIIKIDTLITDTLVLSLPSPTILTYGRIINVSHKDASAGSLTVNGVSLLAGENISLAWNGSSWTEPHIGGAGVTYPLLAPSGLDTVPTYSFVDSPSIGMYSTAGELALVFNDHFLISTPGLNKPYIELFSTAGTLELRTPGNNGVLLNDGTLTVNITANGAPALELDSTTTAGETRLNLWDVDANAMVKVLVGAADSGGTGYKVLRIPN